jgi:potassium/sodium efflux P-type ATPase
MDAIQVARSISSEAAEIVRSKSREVVEKITGPQESALLDASAADLPLDADAIPVEAKPIDVLTKSLGVDPSVGLSVEAANARLQADGPNELKKTKRPTFLALFIVQLLNPIILLLVGAAAASLAVNSITTAIAILVIVFLNAGIAAGTENSAGSALDALSSMSQPEAQVLRGGIQSAVQTKDIVCGDVVVLGVGDVVPADIRLIEATDVKVNEMPLTGESEDVSKSIKLKVVEKGSTAKLTPENMVFSSCSVTSGEARGVVVSTGMNTRVGAIAALLGAGEQKGRCGGLLPNTSANATPLQVALDKLAVGIGKLAIGVCVVVFGIGIALDTRDPSNPDVPSYLFMIMIAITLTVAAIPEGIPLCITIAQAAGCSNMVKQNVLVRRIAAVETLGSASVICSDKTGTLTEGKMRAVKMWAGGAEYTISGTGFDPTVGEIKRTDDGQSGGAAAEVKSTLLAALLNSNARVDQEEENGEVRWVPQGNSSEVPIVVAAGKIGFQAKDLESSFPRVLQVPFSSSRKMMLTVCRSSGQSTLGESGVPLAPGTEMLACVKGAPNYIIDACTQWAGSGGAVDVLTDAVRSEIMGTIDLLSSQALRVLAVAVQPLQKLPFTEAEADDISADDKMSHLCKNMTFLGLVASLDPPREGVQQSVQAAHEGNINVVMITGDYLKTAAAIARDIDVLDSSKDALAAGEALDCSVLRPNGSYIAEHEIDKLTKQAKVFARAQPEDKLQIVHSLQRQGLVCAMTGDGVNDAPALKASDIGVAMGVQGTEVAKGASDVILRDDNFCSIVGAVEKGRVIYAGIQKFVAFIMSVHIAEILQILACILGGMPVMRTPLQILFLILVTDLAPSIALGLEPGQRGIMKERPRPKKQPILLPWMWLITVVNSIILAGVILSIYSWALDHYVDELDVDEIGEDIREEGRKGFTATQLAKARTVAFIALVWSENVRAYTSRSFEKFFIVDLLSNKYMQRAIGLAQAALYLALFLPGLSDILQLKGIEIDNKGWVAAFIGALATLVLCEASKFVMQAMTVQRKQRDASGTAGISKGGEVVSGVGKKTSAENVV